jgi:hypothetical protein
LQPRSTTTPQKLEAIARRIVGFHIDDGRHRADPLQPQLARRRG